MKNGVLRPGVGFTPAPGASAYERSGSPLTSAGLDRPVLWTATGKALLAPLWHRFRLGEGGLLVVNATLAWKGHAAGEAIGLTIVSLVCLLSLYLFNDVIDARDDQHNPKKDRALTRHYARERQTFLAIWLFLTAAAACAGAALDARAAVSVAGVSAINVAYSLFFKRVPLLDLVCVGAWGGVYASIATGAGAWLLAVAAMTAVCHVYQTSDDRDADAQSGFATSAMLAAPKRSLLQLLLVAILMAATWALGAGGVALTFAAFLVYWIAWFHRPRIAWLVTKVHFSMAWAWLLLHV